MNGAVFHTSMMTIAVIKVPWLASGAQVEGTKPKKCSTAGMAPVWFCHNKSRQTTAEMTVGKAQGTSTAARAIPRPANLWLSTRANSRPSRNSRATLITVNSTVFQMLPVNVASLNAFAYLPNPTNWEPNYG